ncbi:MAG TPA: hypothetical protein VJ825_00675, partial [Gemmatimonadaceae bacterium]|nr:hypothetical protein [Gemmatimonadaceae bacterium]
MNRTLCIAALVILCAACAVKTEQSTDTSAVGSTTSAVKPTPDSVVFVQGDPTVHIDSAESTNRPTSPAPAEPSPPPAGTSFRITPNSFGPLRVG